MTPGRCCPTPFKQTFSNKGEALLELKEQRRRVKTRKNKWYPVAPYRCRCGAVHVASKNRVGVFEK